MQKEIVQELLPIFFGNHPNSGVILHKVWNNHVSFDSCLPICTVIINEVAWVRTHPAIFLEQVFINEICFWMQQYVMEDWREVLMAAMKDWYMSENDQTRLSRILDIAQDLKALISLLNLQSFPFVIDLACLAYRREYLTNLSSFIDR